MVLKIKCVAKIEHADGTTLLEVLRGDTSITSVTSTGKGAIQVAGADLERVIGEVSQQLHERVAQFAAVMENAESA